MLGRALHVQAVVRVEVDVPAHGACVVLGVDVGVVAAFGDEGEYGLVGIGPLVAALFGCQLPFQGLICREAMADAEVEAVQAAAVAVILAKLVFIEAVIFLARHRQAQITAVPAEAVAEVVVIDAILAAGQLHARAMAVRRIAGENVDHRHQCVGAIADGVGAAEYLDAFDVLQRHRDVAPVHRGQARTVHRAAVDQHLHAPGFVDVGAVVIDGWLVAGAVADHHPRHQAQQFGDVAGAAGADQFAVEHGHAARHGGRGLFQARGGQNLWQVGVVDEQVVGHGRAAEQGSQQQQARVGRRAMEHDTALYQS
ncbi:hypothetical protein D3C79_655490 [compost metagenome]